MNLLKNHHTAASIFRTPLIAIAVAALQMPALATLGSLTKSPDVGNYWHPLSPGGTYVYANSFVAPQNSVVSSLGTWLNTEVFDPATSLRFQVWGSVGGNPFNGPDFANVLATTGPISGINGPLTFYSALTTSSLALNAGSTYWFSATAVGAAGIASYQVGGHTQNSGGIVDNGTFWYSNDPTGQFFDGKGFTPEMAFQVEFSAVPEPSTLAHAGLLLSLAFGSRVFGFLRKRE